MRKPTLLACFSLLLPSLVAAGAARAATYEVGPGTAYANIGDVPIESLKAGDTVLIHARSTPYREKFGIVGKGTAASPITVKGVPDANGVRPRLIGENATTRLALDYPSDTRGVINVYEASYVVIEGLDITRARGTFKDDNGSSATFQENASAIYLQSGSHITIRDCIMSDSGNGFFSTSASSDVLLEGNYIYGNGNVGSIYEHNNYTDSNGIVFQYNRFGPLCDGCSGGNLKDRSAGTVIRYNWIEGGNRTLDLVEGGWSGLASYRTTLVYGNVLIELNDSGNPQVVHYGGDSGDESSYRKGTLHFVHNTVVSFRSGRTRLMRLSSNDETAEIRNNIIYATAGGSQMSISDGAGKFIMAGNWISSGWTSGLSGGTLTQPAPQITGTNPGFVDFEAADYHLATTSPARNTAGDLEAGAPTVDRQYVTHQTIEARIAEGTPDIGAFECGGGTALPDAGVSPPPADAARTPDAAPPTPDTVRPNSDVTSDTRGADTTIVINRDSGPGDASVISRDTRTSDTPARLDGGQTPRDTQAQDGPGPVDSTTVGRDADRPNSVDALISGRDSGPPVMVGVDAAISTVSPGACTLCPDQRSRNVSTLWLVLGSLILVRARRIVRRKRASVSVDSCHAHAARFSTLPRMRRPTTLACLSLILPLLFAAGAAHATTYEVGPGKPYANIGDVPIESLGAGDVVLIHARSTPYREKFAITTKGTASAPITIRGVRDTNGVRPQLLGENSTTRVALNFPSDARGIINIYEASHVVIEGLDLNRARGAFKDDNGSSATFQANASAIYLQSGSNITVRDCVMRDSGNGFFSTSASSNVLVEGNYVYGNGNVGSIYEHNNYTDSNGIVFQYNRFGPLCAGCSGSNLKDRSAGTVVRYNWIEGGNRALDLVENGGWTGLASYRTTMVYGNLLLELNDSGNPQVVHYGGDSGNESSYRKGTLHFVHNTVVSYRTNRARLIRLSTNDEKAEIRNNIIYAIAGGSQMSISDGLGKYVLAGNWISSGWTTGLSGGTLTQAGPQITGTNPGLVNLAAWDYHISATSPARNAAGALETGAPTVDRQYRPHLRGEARAADGKADIGAFEYQASSTSAQAALMHLAANSDADDQAEPMVAQPDSDDPGDAESAVPLGGCTMAPGERPRRLSMLWLALGALILVPRRRHQP